MCDILQPMLVDSNAYIRESAVQTLAQINMPTEQAFSLIQPLLVDSDGQVRQAAVQTLERTIKYCSASKICDFLQPMLVDSNTYTRESASQSLAKIVKDRPIVIDHAIPLLEHLLTNDNSDIKENARNSLAVINDIAVIAEQTLCRIRKNLPMIYHGYGCDDDIYLSSAYYARWDLLRKIEAMPVKQAWPQLRYLMTSWEGFESTKVMEAARKTFDTKVKAMPVKQALSFLKSLLTDKDKDVRESAEQSLAKITQACLTEQDTHNVDSHDITFMTGEGASDELPL